jgi:sulfhydrogenase subunit gamma (sulfur reductase)
MENIYMPELASILDIKEETPSIKTLTISFQDQRPLVASPGQFVEITVFGYGEFPVSITGFVGSRKEQFKTTIQSRGKVTGEIGGLAIGSTIGIRGPLGYGYPLEAMKGRDVLIATGGIGLAAVRYLLDYLIEKRERYGVLKLLHGARTPADLIYKDTYLFDRNEVNERGLEVNMTVEQPDGKWKGHVGLVTELLDRTEIEQNNTVAVVCGPNVMMRHAAAALAHMGIEDNQIFLSMERRMQCGIGMCGHCMVGKERVCLDGPVMPYGTIKYALEKCF